MLIYLNGEGCDVPAGRRTRPCDLTRGWWLSEMLSGAGGWFDNLFFVVIAVGAGNEVMCGVNRRTWGWGWESEHWWYRWMWRNDMDKQENSARSVSRTQWIKEAEWVISVAWTMLTTLSPHFINCWYFGGTLLQNILGRNNGNCFI